MPGDPRRRLALILGTSSACLAVSDEPRFIDALWGPHLSALIPGQWLMDGGQSAFGAAIDRIVRMHPAFAEFSARGFEALRARDRRARRRPVAGGAARGAACTRCPRSSASARRSPTPERAAAWSGWISRDDVASLEELYVAGLCGLAYGVADIVAAYERAGYAFETIVASGGAAQSPLVRQIVADVTGLPVASPETPEPVLLGSAMIGAAASGLKTVAVGDDVDVGARRARQSRPAARSPPFTRASAAPPRSSGGRSAKRARRCGRRAGRRS